MGFMRNICPRLIRLHVSPFHTHRRMHLQKITLAIVAAALPALACSGVRDASARNSNPELQPVGAQQSGAPNSPTVARADTLPRAGAASDTIKAGAAPHPTPPVLDSL